MNHPRSETARAIAPLALLVAACARISATPPVAAVPAPAPSPAPNAQSGREIPLDPATLDPEARKYLATQYAYPGTLRGFQTSRDEASAAKPPAPRRDFDPQAPRAPALVVYLVGARNPPERGRIMGDFLAGLGLPVLVPGYANDYDIRKLCETATDPDCHGNLRLEAIEGKDLSPHIDIQPPDSLERRIVRMLEALGSRAPAAGWGQYLAGGAPKWSEIIVAGHSHGASSAALIGKVRSVRRVVMLSGPFDNRAGAPGGWTLRPGVTPVDRYYGFSHTKEEQYAGHIKNWHALGLPPLGPAVVVEDAAPPFASSHQLVTGLAPAGNGNPHGTTSAGKAAPRLDDGRYRFEAAWRYLFGL